MRISRMLPGLLIFPLGMLGCSQTWGVRSNSADGVRTVASVGDRTLPIREGTPDSSVQADEAEPLVSPSNRVRISGRVYDDRGEPVPGARVRLAVGGEPGGKAVVATTDPSGAFTLRGLRTGSSYTLIAEYQDKRGAMMTGRIETEAPGTNVRISLRRKGGGPADEDRTSASPARPGVAPISSVEEVDGAEDQLDSSVRSNPEDLEPPAPEAEEAYRDSRARAPVRVSAEDRPSGRGSGWTSGRSSDRDSTSAKRPSARRRSEEGPSGKARFNDAPVDDIDEVNPLPPALDPDPVGSREDRDQEDVTRTSAGSQPVRLAVRPAPPEEGLRSSRPNAARVDVPRDQDDTPRPLPFGVISGGQSTSSQSYAPMFLDQPERSPGERRRGDDRRSRDDPGPSANVSRKPAAGPVSASASSQPRPTWGELVFTKSTVPLDESIRRAAKIDAPRSPRPGAGVGTGTERGKVGSAQPAGFAATQTQRGTEVSCQFDPVERTLKDFQLPDAQGRMVAFHDLDADLVLLDFWGTWCAPCRKSIPHLNKIQKMLGGKKIQVLGIACERVPARDRAAKVAQTVRELKIEYPVLITGMDGNCPVQEAFQIQFYPTMVLLDRQGRIIWREQGATDVTLARMDRFILKNLHRGGGGGGEALQARAAGTGDAVTR